MYWVVVFGFLGSRSLFLSMRPSPKTTCTTFFMVPDHWEGRGTTYWLYSITDPLGASHSYMALYGATARRRDGRRPGVIFCWRAQPGVGAHWRITL